MLRVGLTGGIGAGKSAVAAVLERRGAVVIDADRLAREVVAPGTDGLAAVVSEFGDGVLGPDGALDRPALARRVFGDDAARRRLEGIIHPRVRARTAELTAAAPAGSVVVNDVPLLVETGLAPSYHLVIVVRAGEQTRVARLAATRGMGRDEALRRIRAQATDEQRRAAADVLIDNDGSREGLDAAVEALWRDRLAPFEENLRLRRAAPGEAPFGPGDFERLAARIRHAAGDLVGTVRLSGPHGIVVEAAPGADLAPALLAAGFVPEGSADPGRPAAIAVVPG